MFQFFFNETDSRFCPAAARQNVNFVQLQLEKNKKIFFKFLLGIKKTFFLVENFRLKTFSNMSSCTLRNYLISSKNFCANSSF